VLLDKLGFSMKKRFGQNFMVDPAARKQVLDLLDLPPTSSIWEIGPGLGALTYQLLDNYKGVTAFEIDYGFIRILEQEFAKRSNFTLVQGDVKKTWKAASQNSGVPDGIIGNLPYRSASDILLSLVEGGCHPHYIVATLQKEGAERINAAPGDKNYSSYTVILQTHYKPELYGALPGSAFFPEPEVISSVIRLELTTQVSSNPMPTWYYSLVKAAFSSRRKTLGNNLKPWINQVQTELPQLTVNQLTGAASAAGFSLQDRAETLSPEDYVRFSQQIIASGA
jgi:16S rRNA (adenine1518-N6/adenine1519-N6)-dimethyltransferase